jgi:hypothetical protein
MTLCHSSNGWGASPYARIPPPQGPHPLGQKGGSVPAQKHATKKTRNSRKNVAEFFVPNKRTMISY